MKSWKLGVWHRVSVCILVQPFCTSVQNIHEMTESAYQVHQVNWTLQQGCFHENLSFSTDQPTEQPHLTFFFYRQQQQKLGIAQLQQSEKPRHELIMAVKSHTLQHRLAAVPWAHKSSLLLMGSWNSGMTPLVLFPSAPILFWHFDRRHGLSAHCIPLRFLLSSKRVLVCTGGQLAVLSHPCGPCFGAHVCMQSTLLNVSGMMASINSKLCVQGAVVVANLHWGQKLVARYAARY